MKLVFLRALLSVLLFSQAWADDDETPRILDLFERLPQLPLSDQETDPVELAKELDRLAKEQIEEEKRKAEEDARLKALNIQQTQEEKPKPIVETPKAPELSPASVENSTKLMSKLLLLGENKKLHTYLTRIIRNLQIEGDSAHYNLKISMSPFPNASIQGNNITITAGLLGYVKNEDELASVIAHEMSHSNPDQYAAQMDSPEVEAILSSVNGYKGMDPSQREEIRADLGALDRLVKAGYNPWSQYDLEKRFTIDSEGFFGSGMVKQLYKRVFKEDYDFSSTHPRGEIRMALVKAYIAKKSFEVKGLAQQKSRYTPIPSNLKTLRLRAKTLATLPKMLTWANRGLMTYAAWEYAKLAGLSDSAFGQALSTYGQSAISKIKDVVPNTFDAIMSVGSSAFNGVGNFISDYPKVVFGTLGVAMVGALTSLIKIFWDDDYLTDAESAKKEIKATRKILETELNALKKILDSDANPETKLFTIFKIGAEALARTNSVLSHNDGAKTRNARFALIDAMNKTIIVARNELPKWSLDQQKNFLEKINKSINSLPANCFLDTDFRENIATLISESRRLSIQTTTAEDALNRVSKVANHEYRQMNGVEIADLANNLAKDGNWDLTRDLIMENYDQIESDLHSNKNTNPLLSAATLETIKKLTHMETFRENPKKSRDINFLMLSAENSNKAPPVTTEGLARMAFRRGIAVDTELNNPTDFATSESIAYRPFYQEQEDIALEKHLLSLGSLEEIVKFLDKSSTENNGDILNLKTYLNKFISKNPTLIKSKKDMNLLFDKDYFWPTYSLDTAYSSNAEFYLMQKARELAKEFPNIWKYKPADSERLHAIWLHRARELGHLNDTPESQANAWKYLIRRGVSSRTDTMFQSFINKIKDPSMRHELDEMAMKGGVWDVTVRAEITKRHIRESNEYKELRDNKTLTAHERRERIEKLVNIAQETLKERGTPYAQLLESISQEVRSDYHEAKYIQEQKWPKQAKGEQTEDYTLRNFSKILGEVQNWSKKEQWDFIKFVRGENHVTQRIQDMFANVGVDRVQRMFSVLPVEAKAQLFDTFMDSPKGLMPSDVSVNKGWAKIIVDHLMSKSPGQSREVAIQVLESFLYALEKTGDKGFKSWTLAYLLAMPPSENQTAGDVLKHVLECFGSMGVKLGQFIVAAEILPPEDTEKLRSLQERANIPERFKIHKDLEDITGRKILPVVIGDLLGSASMKYAVGVESPERESDGVLKILRLEAIAHTETEFLQLDQMANYLDGKSKKKYGVFRSIVKAARAAAERELKAADEVEKGAEARKVYLSSNSEASTFIVPREILF